ncbi:MAG: UbiA-like polyprenyltransferase [Desulfovibrionaceae bacterium]
MSLTRDLVLICRMVKIEHSIFALPFAYAGAFLAAGGWPGWRPMLVLTVAMVAVRSWAMASNRLLDLPIDRRNPRTQDRPLVTGELTIRFTLGFLAGCAVVFILACALMNRLCFELSFVALAWSAIYSLTKRFTWLCHFVLGSVLGLAPIAGWLCVDPSGHWAQWWLFAGVTLWVAGFDLLYALQDVAFDKAAGLYSLPARFGVATALRVSARVHVAAPACFLLAGFAAGLGWVYLLTMLLVTGILWWEHRLISPGDLSRVNLAFFTLNGVVAVFVFAGILVDMAVA